MCHVLDNQKSNWSKLIIYENFKLLPLSFVQVLLRSDELTLTEEILWDRCILWAKHQFEKDHSMNMEAPGGLESLDTDTVDEPSELLCTVHSVPPFFCFRPRARAPYKNRPEHFTQAIIIKTSPCQELNQIIEASSVL